MRSPRSSRTRNLATDHQNLIMEVLRKTADKYGLVCLLHEKPFAGINGSGKHNNWSMSTDTGENLLNPGDNPHDNAQFLVFTHGRHPRRRQVQRDSASVDRVGAQRSPPGRQRSPAGDHLDLPGRSAQRRLRADRKRRRQERASKAACSRPACRSCRKLPKEAGDRNRTSPFAFTGNKFEFRAVGSSQNIAGANTVLNTIVAESLDFIATKLEADVKGGKDLTKAVQELLPGDHQGEQEGHLQRQRLRRRMARRSREARLAEPEEHGRSAAGRHPQGHDRSVHEVQGLHRARNWTAASTSCPKRT